MFEKLLKKVRIQINKLFRKAINRHQRKLIKNNDLTLISSNCTGCLMLHDLGLRYNSPFVNMFINADDYIKLLKRFSEYMQQSLQCIENTDSEYPLVALGDITLHCVHYKSFEEVVEKWNSRKQRMNLENCFVIFTDRDGCTYEHLKTFDELPFKNKIVFTHKEYKDISSSFYIHGFEEQDAVGALQAYKGWNGVRIYDEFDYITWFNEN
ncbi:MAG: DUF1919 domain-containing protein [Ruminococcaceae bacterium]|nr:DUF1919 domain-containing protein [Oscillospiraceae bacterium]